MDDALLLRGHCAKRVEKVSSPHDLRDHDNLVDQLVSISDALVRMTTCGGSVRVHLMWERTFWRSFGFVFSWFFRFSGHPVGVKFFEKQFELRLHRHRRLFRLDVFLLFVRTTRISWHFLDCLGSLCESFEELLWSCRWVVTFQTLDDLHY